MGKSYGGRKNLRMEKSYGGRVVRESEMNGCDTLFPEDEESICERALAVTEWGDPMRPSYYIFYPSTLGNYGLQGFSP